MSEHHSDSDYFRQRASEERAAARRAQDPRARQSHLDLAERYSQAAQMGAANLNDEEAHAPVPARPLLQPEFRILT